MIKFKNIGFVMILFLGFSAQAGVVSALIEGGEKAAEAEKLGAAAAKSLELKKAESTLKALEATNRLVLIKNIKSISMKNIIEKLGHESEPIKQLILRNRNAALYGTQQRITYGMDATKARTVLRNKLYNTLSEGLQSGALKSNDTYEIWKFFKENFKGYDKYYISVGSGELKEIDLTLDMPAGWSSFAYSVEAEYQGQALKASNDSSADPMSTCVNACCNGDCPND